MILAGERLSDVPANHCGVKPVQRRIGLARQAGDAIDQLRLAPGIPAKLPAVFALDQREAIAFRRQRGAPRIAGRSRFEVPVVWVLLERGMMNGIAIGHRRSSAFGPTTGVIPRKRYPGLPSAGGDSKSRCAAVRGPLVLVVDHSQ